MARKLSCRVTDHARKDYFVYSFCPISKFVGHLRLMSSEYSGQMKYINSIMAIIFLSYIFSSILQSGYFLNITFFLGMLELFGGHSWSVFSSFSFFLILWSCPAHTPPHPAPPPPSTGRWDLTSTTRDRAHSPYL